jgi:hypothetical protein
MHGHHHHHHHQHQGGGWDQQQGGSWTGSYQQQGGSWADPYQQGGTWTDPYQQQAGSWTGSYQQQGGGWTDPYQQGGTWTDPYQQQAFEKHPAAHNRKYLDLAQRHRKSTHPHHKFEADPSISSLVDLRSQCPPVYDQGHLGSCTANALAAAFEFDEMKMNASLVCPVGCLSTTTNARRKAT